MKFSKNMSTAVKFYCQEHQAVIGRNHEFNLIAQYFIQLDKVSSWSLKAYRHGIPYRGVDQVQAAQQCYLKAETWRREDRSDVANNKFVKAEKKYFTVSTQHILHSCGLGKPDYLSMATEPTRLIMELYSDPSIIQSNVINMPSEQINILNLGFVTSAIFPIVNFLSPGINEAVERIIALHELDRVKITLELLNQWLQPEAALQATMNEMPPPLGWRPVLQHSGHI
ncbi:unnamed protein product, partial [Nesidiocoris tenuis]